MVTLGVLPLTGFMFLNRFNLLEDQSCADLNIGIINFEKLSQNFIADSMNWFLNSRSDYKTSFATGPIGTRILCCLGL